MHITSLATSLPPYTLHQSQAKEFAQQMFGASYPNIDRLLPIYDNAAIEQRNFCVPLEWFGERHSFREKNDLYIANAIELSERAIGECLAKRGIGHDAVDYLLFVSTTGLATPSIDARLITSLPFRPDVKRLPIWGLGCAGGVAGLSRAREIVAADPTARVLVVVVELCGLTFMADDLSKANLIASALFSDGCAVVLVEGEEAAGSSGGFRLLGSATRTMPDSLDVMGWDISEEGFGIVISRDIPTIVRTFMRESIDVLLGEHGLAASDIRYLIAHPGGAKVLEAYQESLERPRSDFRHTWGALRDHGNMSAASVLFVLERFMEDIERDRKGLADGERLYGLMGALGPGFSSELMVVGIEN